jgi:hypothetical protein
MDAIEQMQMIMATLSEAKANGKEITIEQAQRKLHREYITRQLWNEHGLRPKGFLIISGFIGSTEEGFISPDPKIDTIFNSYLNMSNKLTGATGRKLRAAMDDMGIDYQNSPTYPLDNLEENAA